MKAVLKLAWKAVKTVILGLLALGVIFGVWRSTFGYKSKQGENYQLRYNLIAVREDNEILQEENSELKSELKEEKQRADRAEQQRTEVTEEGKYLKVKFPSDGNYYVDSYENIFYRDTTCTKIVENPRFMSPAVDENLKAANGFTVKALRLEDGSICYCPQDTLLYLVTEQEWQEYLKEQKQEE